MAVQCTVLDRLSMENMNQNMNKIEGKKIKFYQFDKFDKFDEFIIEIRKSCTVQITQAKK